MHNAEAAIEPAFYDHEDETVRSERVAPDWGADEVFATVPRRRFRGDRHGAGAVARRSAAHRPAAAPAVDDETEAAGRAAWLAEVEAELDAAPAALEVANAEAAVMTDGVELAAAPAQWEAPAEEPPGRRTVTITGRPEGTPRERPLAEARRRPPRTVDERIGGRPDRVAGWAFGMGILLIVVAAFS